MKRSARSSPPADDRRTNTFGFSGICRASAIGRPSQAEAEALADHILDAGWKLLLGSGFEKFSFDRLARFARTGKATIYARFASKAEFLRALLIREIERRQTEIFSSIQGKGLSTVLPELILTTVQHFLSPEGRLIDRLIDWLDHEAEPDRESVRGWALNGAVNNASSLIAAANQTGETEIADPIRAARFLVEGIAGHAKLASLQGQFDESEHATWAHELTTMVLSHFDMRCRKLPADDHA